MNAVPFEYNGQPVQFTTAGWINATEIAKRHGRRLDHWLANKETEAYIAALGRHLNTRDSGYLIQARRGAGGGTWLHPKLAVVFARWLDVDFAVWCDLHIDALLRGEVSTLQQFDQACRHLEDRRQLASAQGRGLAQWRFEKQPLEARVEYWRRELQMELPLRAIEEGA